MKNNDFKWNIKRFISLLIKYRKIKKQSKVYLDKWMNFCFSYDREFNSNGFNLNSYDSFLIDWYDKKCIHVDPFIKKEDLNEFNINTPNGNISCLMAKKDSNKWVIGLHGWTENKYLVLRLVDHFYNEGYNILTIDQYAHGLSYGDKTDIAGKKSLEALDIAIEYLKDNFNPDIIGLIGNSMGASLSILYSQKYPKKVSWVIADSGFNHLLKQMRYKMEVEYRKPWYEISYGLNKKLKQNEIKWFNLLKEVKKSKDIPTFFIHSNQDNFVIVDHSIEIFNKKQKYKENNILWNPNRGNHVNLVGLAHDKYLEKTIHFAKNNEK